MPRKERDFCDWRPCDTLERMVRQLMPSPSVRIPYPTGDGVPFVLVPDASQGFAVAALFFHYCPFCGTRIQGDPRGKDVKNWVSSVRLRRPH